MKPKPCPCGKHPEDIGFVHQVGFSFVFGDCDCEWQIAFDDEDYKELDFEIAQKIWDAAPRWWL